jgi:hypothetical protein
MNLKNLGLGALVGLLLTFPLMAVLFLGNQLFGFPFVPYDIFDWMAQVLPGRSSRSASRRSSTCCIRWGWTLPAAPRLRTPDCHRSILGRRALAGAVFYVVMQAPGQTRCIGGIGDGSIVGLPQIGISLAISQTPTNQMLSLTWLALVYLA